MKDEGGHAAAPPIFSLQITCNDAAAPPIFSLHTTCNHAAANPMMKDEFMKDEMGERGRTTHQSCSSVFHHHAAATFSSVYPTTYGGTQPQPHFSPVCPITQGATRPRPSTRKPSVAANYPPHKGDTVRTPATAERTLTTARGNHFTIAHLFFVCGSN
jgi:hypothetical protein